MDGWEKSARRERKIDGLPLSGAGWLMVALDGSGRRHEARLDTGDGSGQTPRADEDTSGAVGSARLRPGLFAFALGWLRRTADRPFGSARNPITSD